MFTFYYMAMAQLGVNKQTLSRSSSHSISLSLFSRAQYRDTRIAINSVSRQHIFNAYLLYSKFLACTRSILASASPFSVCHREHYSSFVSALVCALSVSVCGVGASASARAFGYSKFKSTKWLDGGLSCCFVHFFLSLLSNLFRIEKPSPTTPLTTTTTTHSNAYARSVLLTFIVQLFVVASPAQTFGKRIEGVYALPLL